jgi:hypothetical protein
MIGVDDDGLLARQRLAYRLRVHVGRAFHVAADPGAEAQHGGRLEIRYARAVQLLQRRRDLFVERRHDAIQHLGEVEDGVLALVGHRQPLPRMFLGLPAGGDLGAQARVQAAMLVRIELRIQAVEEDPCHALLAPQLRPARGFRRMGDEHGLDAQRREQVQHLVEAEPFGTQLRQRVLDAAGLRAAAVGEEVFAAAAYAMHPLGQVDRLEPRGKRPDQVARDLRRAACDAQRELPAASRVAVPPGEGRLTVAFDQIEQRVATLLAQRLPDQHAELVDVLAQREVLGGELDLVAMHGPRDSTRRGLRGGGILPECPVPGPIDVR